MEVFLIVPSKRVPPDQRKNLDWINNVLPVARQIVASYDTQVTLRQLFYRLVSLPHGHPGRIPNKTTTYNTLSAYTAEGRREGTFPELVDQRRWVVVPSAWDSARDAVEALRDQFRRDRTEGQEFQVYIGVEKAGLVNLLSSWFGDLGLPILPLGGHASQGFVDTITRRVHRDGRAAILLYAGDHDPAGWGILQNFVDRTDFWMNDELPEWNPEIMPLNRGWKSDGRLKHTKPIPNLDRYRKYRVALQPEQCDEHDLPRNAAKEKDPNLNQFLATFADTLTPDEVDDGLGVQVEVDALEPPVLRQLFTDAINQYWDEDAYNVVMEEEEADIAVLDRFIEGLG